MEYLNLILGLIAITYIIYKENRFSIYVSRTFWCRKPLGINIIWNKPVSCVSYAGVNANSLFYIPLCNHDKAEKWDDDMFDSGEYKKYNKD